MRADHRTRRTRPAVTVALAASLLVAACGGGGGGTGAASGSSSSSDLSAQCPVGALAGAVTKPVPITLWHSMTRANEQTLQALTDRFNTSQGDVRVTLVNQTSYDDTLTKYKAALGGGALPDLVQIQDVDQQLMIDSRSVVPAQACVDAEHVDLADFVPRVLEYYRVQGTLWAVPFNTSNPILYYNKAAFRRAGLDPDKPPTTLDELRTAAQALVQTGTTTFGLAIKLDPWYLEEWTAMAGETYVDHGNGRDGRATKVTFDGATGTQVFSWLSGMVADRLAEGTPRTGFDNLLALGNDVAGMTLDTSAALGTIVQVLSSGQFPNVELGAARLPGPAGGGGPVVAGGALYLVKGTTPEKVAAAWRFAKFLSEPAQQADWAAGTGYVPIRTSAVDLPVLQAAWKAQPELRIAYDQLLSGADNRASAGPVIGAFEPVRSAVVTAQESMFQQGVDPATALAAAAREANAAIADYESRVGG